MVHVFCSLYMIRWNAIYAMPCSLQLVTCLMQLIFYFKIELQVVLAVGKCNCKPNCKVLVFIIMCSIKSTIGIYNPNKAKHGVKLTSISFVVNKDFKDEIQSMGDNVQERENGK